MKQRILVVDDDRYDNDRYCQILRSAGYNVQGAMDAEQAIQIIKHERFDVVLLDMLLPLRRQGRLDFGGIEVLRQIKERDEATQVIAVTGYGSRELAAEAMASGALDYITKDPDTDDRLPGSVKIAIARARILRAVRQVNDGQHSEENLALPNHLVADSIVMRQMLRRAQRLGHLDSTLLIQGEAGVGKELIANVIHMNSRYASGPFTVVFCRNLSHDLNELWGNINKSQIGLCAEAEGGTLVLKSIQDLPFNQQKLLVPLMERKIYQPLGSPEMVEANMRIIVTSTVDLERLVRQGRFWRPLYEILSLAILDVPPLRERRDKDDILAIAGYLLHRYGLATGISPDAATFLAAYDYIRSNITELETILRHAASNSGGELIYPIHLPEEVRSVTLDEVSNSQRDDDSDGIDLSVRFIPGDNTFLIWDSIVGGSTRSQLHLPFRESELLLLLRALDAVQWPNYSSNGSEFEANEQEILKRFGVWTGTQIPPDVSRRIGRMLYQSVIADPAARTALESARNIAAEKGLSLTLTLRFPPDAVMLAALPWELLWGERQPLVVSRPKVSFVRYIDIAQALPKPPIVGKKLRLLAVCPSAGIPDNLHNTELTIRMKALQSLAQEGRMIVEELRPVNINHLTNRLLDGEQVDILHFYGHGVWKDGTAYLQLDSGLISAGQLANLLDNVSLVVLHACRSGKIGNDDLFTGIAPMLSAEGVSAVVAMQFTVSVDAANRFADVLYRNLAAGESLQSSVAKARQALYTEHKDSWYVPVVYIRSREQRPFLLTRI